MNYPGDFPPSPEERAGLRLAANAAWLARAKERGHAPDGVYKQYPNFEQADEQMMERDNRKALAAAARDIEAERKAHKCYICGRRDLRRYARWYGLWAAGLLGLRLLSNAPEVTIVGYLGAAALGAALAAAVHEGVEPEEEQALRKKFNETSHG